MITGKSEELNDMAANNVCAADGGALSVDWNATASMYYLRCGICNVTKAVKRVLSPTEEYKAGTELPPALKDNVEKSIDKFQKKHPGVLGTVTIGGIPATDLGTGALLDIEIRKALVEYACRYGLDARRSHVCLMYGQPYITIDGYLYHARRSTVSYSLASRPLTDAEKISYQLPEGCYAWQSTVTLLPSGANLTGLGVVRPEELTEKSKHNPNQLAAPVVAKHPWQLAQKRAEWQALRRAFPIGETQKGNE